MFRMMLCLFVFLPIFSILTELKADSGGELSPDQAAYDVEFYSLNLRIEPETKSIEGSLLCRAKILGQLDSLVLDLVNTLTVDSVYTIIENEEYFSKSFSHNSGKLNIHLPSTANPDDRIITEIFYHGIPAQPQSPPWQSGFVWGSTPSGSDWIGVCCEFDGADVWWPCKDHPSDEPDSVLLKFTVPDPLVCVSNGVFKGSRPNTDGTSTYEWFVSGPINNYNVTFYAAEFELIEDIYQSVSAEDISFYFWVIPENYDIALNYMQVFKNEFSFLESACGPFPFGHEKLGWANSPYYGMEHQTIIAYGNDFHTNGWGYDYIHLHELSHEWWGNLITAKDWSDVWIHEGLATYMEALYVEHISGMNLYHNFMNWMKPYNNHKSALAPYETLTSKQAFDSCNPYNRGAWVMHTLRYHLGDDLFFELLKRWLYPDQSDLDNTNGRQCRILSTEDMKNEAENITRIDLNSFFEVFFRERWYPVLHVLRSETKADFTWHTDNNVPLDLNVPVSINGINEIVDMNSGMGTLDINEFDELIIDPEKWILMAAPVIETSIDQITSVIKEYSLGQNYPNPFNAATEIKFSIPEDKVVKIRIMNTKGETVSVLENRKFLKGSHCATFSADMYESGIYFYSLETDELTLTRRMLLLK